MTQMAVVNGAKVFEIIHQNVFDKPFNLYNSLAALQMPILIIHGEADSIPSITAQSVHECIAGSKFILIKNCGHFPYVEEPEVYFKHLATFLYKR